MENPIKIYDLGGTPISGNHHVILFPGFGCCWYQWRKVSALPVLVVEPIVRALDEDPPVHHVEVSKKMEVPQNHAKLVVINAKTQWFVVPIFSGTPLKWRDPIIRLGYDEDWIWLSKCGDPKLMFSLCSPFPTQRVTAFWSVRVQLRPGIRVFLKIYPLIQYGSRWFPQSDNIDPPFQQTRKKIGPLWLMIFVLHRIKPQWKIGIKPPNHPMSSPSYHHNVIYNPIWIWWDYLSLNGIMILFIITKLSHNSICHQSWRRRCFTPKGTETRVLLQLSMSAAVRGTLVGMHPLNIPIELGYTL